MLTFILLLTSQILLGNFLETKLMGKTLNISPIVLIIFLSLMGKLWGASWNVLECTTISNLNNYFK